MTRLLMVVFLLPASIFSWSWFSTPTTEERVDFACPYHCGQWGSESIQTLEWQFVQCLYEADKLQDFIEGNLRLLSNYRNTQPIIEPEFLQRPVNFHSEWYQKMLNSNQLVRLAIINTYDYQDGWVIFWDIKNIDHVDGNHIGKIFKRNKNIGCWFNGIDEDNDYTWEEEKALEKEHENDPDWNKYFWETQTERQRYCFKNRIDFQNACLQLEQDIFDLIQDDYSKEIDNNLLFKNEVHNRFGNLACKLQEVKNSYSTIFEKCSRLHHAPSAEYELVLKQFENGDYLEAIEALKALLNKVNLDSLEAGLASNIYTSKGWAENETLQCDEAIASLSNAIRLNPSNPDAYFERAVAYFEAGQFDLSLYDYLNQGKDVSFKTYQEDWGFSDFSKGFAKGGINGIRDASTEFLPSIYNSVSGVGNFLWLTVQHPIDAPKQLIGSATEFCSYLRECDKAELVKLLVPEMYELVDQWDNLTHEKRGELLGYSLGKYGLDVFLPVATVEGLKYVKVFHEIKRAEKLCIFQTLAKSPESKEALTQAATKWENRRKDHLAKAQLEIDKHSKHVPGAWNYEEGKGIMTHSNPQKLLTEHAGRGQKIRGIPGQPDYRERVDFGEIIGYYVDEETKIKTLTTMGIIRYSKEGAHIVPARPKK